jgi:hypothetical protein
LPVPSSDTSIWTILLPVIVGGAIGIVASFVGPWFIERVKEKNERRKRRREKFEELVSAVYEFDNWLNRIKADGNLGEVGSSPPIKLGVIARVYFPGFLEKISKFGGAAVDYQLAIQRAQKRLAGKTSEINDGLMDAYNPYAREKNELLDELEKFAGKEFR